MEVFVATAAILESSVTAPRDPIDGAAAFERWCRGSFCGKMPGAVQNDPLPGYMAPSPNERSARSHLETR